MNRQFAAAVLVLASALLAACAIQPKVPYSTQGDVLAELPPGVTDRRGRFREIFCAVMADHGSALPDNMPCDQALVRVGTEPPPPDEPVDLGHSRADYLVGLVPGLGWECIKGWLDHDNSGPRLVLDGVYRQEGEGRAAVADRVRARALCIEDAVSGRHHARDLRARWHWWRPGIVARSPTSTPSSPFSGSTCAFDNPAAGKDDANSPRRAMLRSGVKARVPHARRTINIVPRAEPN